MEKIVPCVLGCPDCNQDIEDYDDLIAELCVMHFDNSRDPAVLCHASFQEFKRKIWAELPRKQSRLFQIAQRHGLSWTQI